MHTPRQTSVRVLSALGLPLRRRAVHAMPGWARRTGHGQQAGVRA
jgi:hypothetical protein